MAHPRMRQEGSVVGAANTPVIITLGAPGAQNRQLVRSVFWSYDGDPTGGLLEIYENVTERVLSLDITVGGPGFMQFPGEGWGTAVANHDVTVILSAGGQGIVGRLVVIWQTSWYEAP